MGEPALTQGKRTDCRTRAQFLETVRLLGFGLMREQSYLTSQKGGR